MWKRIWIGLLALLLGLVAFLIYGCVIVLKGRKFESSDARPLFAEVMDPIPEGVEPYDAHGMASIATTSITIEFRLTKDASEIFRESRGFHRLTGEKLAEERAKFTNKDFVPDEVYIKARNSLDVYYIYIQGQKGFVFLAY